MTTKTGTQRKSPTRRKTRQPWHLVTNHQNMLYMLAAGMAMSPAGFRGKHYADSLGAWPGWIPLFRDKVGIPAEVLNHATSERRHLLPCIATFDLGGLSGPARMLSRNGSIRDVATPRAKKRKDDIALLVRAPLPLTLLSGIGFRSSEDRQAFESAAGDVSNVDLSPHRIEVAESLFSTLSTGMEMDWPPVPLQGQLFETETNDPPALGQALGGMLAMLYHLANRSDLGLATFRLAAGAAHDGDNDPIQADPVLAGLPDWMDGGGISGEADIRARLFWGIVQALVEGQTKERPQAPVDAALACLESQLDLPGEPEFRPRLERLIADMRGLGGLGGGTVTELLEQHKGSLSRPLLLFCLREHCTDLLEFSHPLPEDAECLLAGILFGIRDGWLQLPRELRDPDLYAYAAYRMADAEHGKQGGRLAMDAPPHPKPLREFFSAPVGEWDNMTREAAVEIASQSDWSDWNDCIQTRITLAEGDHPASFERNGRQVVLPGRVAAVTEISDQGRFLDRLGQWPPVAHRIESEMRRKLANVQETGAKANGNGPSCG